MGIIADRDHPSGGSDRHQMMTSRGDIQDITPGPGGFPQIGRTCREHHTPAPGQTRRVPAPSRHGGQFLPPGNAALSPAVDPRGHGRPILAQRHRMPVPARHLGHAPPCADITRSLVRSAHGHNGAVMTKPHSSTPPRRDARDPLPASHVTLPVGVPPGCAHGPVGSQPHGVRPPRVGKGMNVTRGNLHDVGPLLHITFTRPVLTHGTHRPVRLRPHGMPWARGERPPPWAAPRTRRPCHRRLTHTAASASAAPRARS